MKSGPIVLVEDDEDDRTIFEDVLRKLEIPNSLISFDNCSDAFDYLKSTTDHPFIIFSDVNLPLQSGIEFKRQIDDDPQLRQKSIPFVFYSTSVDPKSVTTAYTEMTVQGFFQKKSSFEDIMNDVRLILDYWKNCKHPNTL